MRTRLIHTINIGGHQLEYIHHLYIGALNIPHDEFVFVLPQRFLKDSKKLEWPQASHIRIVIQDQEEEPTLDSGRLKRGWMSSKTIGKYVKKYQATDVYLIELMGCLPFLPLFVKRSVRVSGIVYRIYLYEWKEESLLMKLQDVAKYWLMSRCKVFHRVFMCNDSSSANCLNRIYKTNKFTYMPDPVASLIGYKGNNVREQLGIEKGKKILLHPGGMDSYKNTLGILRALLLLKEEETNKVAIILAGRVIPNIREEFDKLYNQVKRKVQIIFLEGYLPFEQLADLFVTCDYVLVPYTVKSQSSGIVGHSAYYGKPVIAVRGGIIGKMVRTWRLGELLYRSSDVSIYQFIMGILDKPSYSTEGNGYLESHSVEMFYKTIYGLE